MISLPLSNGCVSSSQQLISIDVGASSADGGDINTVRIYRLFRSALGSHFEVVAAVYETGILSFAGTDD